LRLSVGHSAAYGAGVGKISGTCLAENGLGVIFFWKREIRRREGPP
jgi:hypothetical protein